METNCYFKLIEAGCQDADSFVECGIELWKNKEYEDAIVALNKALTFDANQKKAYNYLGNAKAGLGNFEEAFADYEMALQIDPFYTKAFIHRGVTRYLSGRIDEAIIDFNNAIQIDPKSATAYSYIGASKYSLGKKEEAIEYYNKAIEIDPNDAVSFNYRGIAKSNLGRKEDAIDDYNQAIKIDPYLEDAYYNRACAKHQLSRNEEALLDFNKTIQINPNNVHAFVNLGVVKDELERNEEALEDFNKALKIDPNNVNAFINRGATKAKIGLNEEALEDLNKALKIDPNNVNALISRGAIKSKIALNEEALEDLNKAIQIDPNNVNALSNRGVIKSKIAQNEEALEDLNKAIQIDPNNVNALSNRGEVKSKMCNKEEALEDFNKAIQIDPYHANALSNRGSILAKIGLTKDAFEDLNKALKIDPNNVNAFIILAVLKSKIGLNNEALEAHNKETLEYLDKVIQIDPYNANALSDRGLANFNLSRIGKAFEDLNKAIQIDLYNANAINNLGTVKLKLGLNEEALNDFNNAIDIDPYNSSAYCNRGITKAKIGSIDDAIRDYDRAIQIDPYLAYAFSNRGLVKEELGRTYEACIDYRRAIFLNEFYLSMGSMNSILHFFHTTFQAPLLIHKVLQSNPKLRTSVTFQALVIENGKQCYPLLLWMAWLRLSSTLNQENAKSADDLHYYSTQSKNSEWLRALVLYHAGDPITSFKVLDELDDGQAMNFQQQYFYVLSADSILHDEREAIREFAKSAAIELSMSIDPHEMQNYWAARLLLYCEEYDAAIICINNCQSLSVIHYLSICEAYRHKGLDDSEIAGKALQLAQQTNWSPSSILTKKHLLPLENMGQYLEEIEDVIRYYDAEEIINWIFADGNIKPRFWEIWDADSLIEPLRNYRIAELEQKIRNEFEETLSLLIENKQTDSSIFKNPKVPNRWEAFKLLNNSEDVVFEISTLIYNSTLPQHIIADLLEYFYIMNKIPFEDTYHLYFYLSVCKKISTPNQAMIDGATESGKILIESLSKNLIEYGFVAGMTSLGFLSNPIVSGAALSLAILGKQFLLNNVKSTNKTFEEFKKDFQIFIFNEYEFLGEEKFYEKYPVKGFDHFLKRK